jgi:TRAP-type uncharacterized transport system fused permease subunit
VLLQGTVLHVVTTSVMAVLGIAILSVGISGWLRRRIRLIERLLLVSAAVLMFLPQPVAKLGGMAMAAVLVAWHWKTSAVANV